MDEIKKRKEKKGEVFERREFGDGVRQRLTDEEVLAQKQSLKRKSDTSSGEKKAKKSKSTFGSSDELDTKAFVMSHIFGKT